MKAFACLKTSWVAVALLVLVLPGLAVAQEAEPLPDTPPAGEVKRSMVVASGSDGAIQFFATDSGDGTFMTVPLVAGSFAPSPDIFSLANDFSIQKEIELGDEQREQMEEINKEFAARLNEHVREITSGDVSPEKRNKLGELIQELNEEKRKRMEGVLLPHQFERLRQISLQTRMKQAGDADTLVSEEIARELGLTDEQKERLKQRAEELKKETNEKIAEIRKEAREKLLRELTREQRQRLEEMTGAEFSMPGPEEYRNRIREFRNRADENRNAPGRVEKRDDRDR